MRWTSTSAHLAITFVHDDAEFEDLLRIVAGARRLSLGLVEEDHWVTHTLWALHPQGFDIWFKGGTSLSKGFGLIERFSEDLDLKVKPGRVAGVPALTNWKSDGTKATAERKDYFERLASRSKYRARLSPSNRSTSPGERRISRSRIRGSTSAISPGSCVPSCCSKSEARA
jgi:hypothetical protein